MKFICVFVLAAISSNVWASVNLNHPVTMANKNITTEDALRKIAQQTGVTFKFSHDLHFQKKISMMVKDASLKDVLDFIAVEEQLTWKVIDEHSIQISAVAAK